MGIPDKEASPALAGVIPPCDPTGAGGRAAQGGTAQPSALSAASCPQGGAMCLSKTGFFRQLTSLNDGFSGLVVITHCFHVDPGMFQRVKARGFSSVPRQHPEKPESRGMLWFGKDFKAPLIPPPAMGQLPPDQVAPRSGEADPEARGEFLGYPPYAEEFTPVPWLWLPKIPA